MRVLVIGPNKCEHFKLLNTWLDHVKELKDITCLIHGNRTETDRLADEWASRNDVPVLVFPTFFTNITDRPRVVKKTPQGRYFNSLAEANTNRRMVQQGKPDLVLSLSTNSKKSNLLAVCERAEERGKLGVIKIGC